MRHASSGRGVTMETLTDGQMSGKSGTKTENGHISTATAEVEPLEAWMPGPRWKGARRTITTPRRRGVRCRRRPSRDDPDRVR